MYNKAGVAQSTRGFAISSQGAFAGLQIENQSITVLLLLYFPDFELYFRLVGLVPDPNDPFV